MQNNQKKMNKEQLLFIVTSLFAGILFYTSYSLQNVESYSTPPIQYNAKKHRTAHISQLFPQDSFHHYWANERFIFRRVDYQKKMPPLNMKLPTISKLETIFLPTIPSPAENYWHVYPTKTVEIINTSIVVPENSSLKKTIKEPVYGRIAQGLLRKVYDQDVVIMNNGSRFAGKIITENDREIIIYVESDNKSSNYDLLKGQIQKINYAISIEEVCKQELKKMSDLSLPQRIFLAQSFVELELYTLAETTFKAIIKDSPTNEDAYVAFVDYLLFRLKYEEALVWIYKAEANIANCYQIKKRHTEVSLQLGLTGVANQLLEGLSSKDKDLYTARVTAQSKNYNDLEVYSDNLLKLGIHSDEANYLKGYSLFAQNRFVEAMDLLQKVKNNTGFYQDAQNVIGCIYYYQGNLPSAKQTLLENANRGHLLSWFNLSLVYFATNAIDEAIQVIERLRENIVIPKYHGQILSTLAFFKHKLQNNTEEVSSLLNEALKSDTENELIQYLLAEINNDDLAKSYEHNLLAIQYNFKFIPALLKLIEITYVSENYDDTLKYLKELFSRDVSFSVQQKVHLLNIMTQVYLILENTEAEAILQKSLQLQKTTDNLKLAAILANKNGDYELAIAYLNKILEVSPQDKYANYYKEKIELNENSIYWEDSFSRRDNERIHRGWQEEENNGIIIQLRDSQVFFSGVQRTEDPTQVSKKVAYEQFISFSGELNESSKAYAGIMLTDGSKNFFFAIAPNKSAVFSDNAKEWKVVETTFDQSTVNKLEVQRLSRQKNLYRFTINGQVILDNWQIKFGKNQLRIGLFGKSDLGTAWSMYIDNVRIVEKMQ